MNIYQRLMVATSDIQNRDLLSKWTMVAKGYGVIILVAIALGITGALLGRLSLLLVLLGLAAGLSCSVAYLLVLLRKMTEAGLVSILTVALIGLSMLVELDWSLSSKAPCFFAGMLLVVGIVGGVSRRLLRDAGIIG